MDSKGLKNLVLKKLELLIEAYKLQSRTLDFVARHRRAGLSAFCEGAAKNADIKGEREAIAGSIKALRAMAKFIGKEGMENNLDDIARILLAVNEEWTDHLFRETCTNNALALRLENELQEYFFDMTEEMEDEIKALQARSGKQKGKEAK